MLRLLLAVLVLDDRRANVRIHVIVPIPRDVLYALLAHGALHLASGVNVDGGFDGGLVHWLVLERLVGGGEEVGRAVGIVNVRLVFL